MTNYSKNLTSANPTTPDKYVGPMWLDQYGTPHPVHSMRTSHLFFVIRMLWNHSAPEHLQLRPFKRYRIHRSPEYIAGILPVIYDQLMTRDDLAENHRRELDIMRAHWLPELKPLRHAHSVRSTAQASEVRQPKHIGQDTRAIPSKRE